MNNRKNKEDIFFINVDTQNLDELIEKIIPLLQLRQVNTGTDIIQQGDVGEFLYVITKGEVLVLREGGKYGRRCWQRSPKENALAKWL